MFCWPQYKLMLPVADGGVSGAEVGAAKLTLIMRPFISTFFVYDDLGQGEASEEA